jgi:hypothetical protein
MVEVPPTGPDSLLTSPTGKGMMRIRKTGERHSHTFLAPLRRKNTPDSLNHKLEVRPGTALVDVKQVKINPLVKTNDIAILPRLPVTRNARLHEQTLALVRGVEVCLTPQCRTRSHDAHIPKKHIEELGQLIDTGLSNEVANPRDSRFILDLEDRTILLVEVLEFCQACLSIRIRGVKLEHFESLLILTHALLYEKDQASEIINLDGNRYNHIKPPEEREH